ncbi:Serine/threonine-protein kinase [Malassezia pachydermatis]
MTHPTNDAYSGGLTGDSLVGTDAYPLSSPTLTPTPPISIANHAKRGPVGEADLGYLSPQAVATLSPESQHLFRSSSPLRPVQRFETSSMHAQENTGLVDPEMLSTLASDTSKAAPIPVTRPSAYAQTSSAFRSAQPSPVIPPSQAGPSMPVPMPVTTNSAPPPAPRHSYMPRSDSTRFEGEEQFRYHLGDYMLGRTIGAGSMGKVKYGYCKADKRRVAVKIIPRHTSVNGVMQSRAKNKQPSSSTQSQSEADAALSRAAAKDASKEVRIVREGHLQMLLLHPYICRMREMIVHQNHYYMVFEHINGGQMLDYIIAHGRLRERAARGFARQIGSALQYCHANNVVHRDLKIENILISKSGNCKIIDFGLSNLFSPRGHLNTFCGSLYFAAPELLNARVYTGPEVDVWSFGVVLYVLVCGKVPFDDQSMPVLHARIKRGIVEYPAWLSPECKHLLSRMLVTNPHRRATLEEVVSHPWMLKGFDYVEPSYLPKRTPLQAGHLDRRVIERMHGFEFGTTTEIEHHLNTILSSDAYLAAVSQSENGFSPAEDHTSSTSTSNGNRLSRQFSAGLNFYKRHSMKASEAPSEPLNAEAPPGMKGPLNPTFGFHPLISIYFLVREKMEREVRGEDGLNSSDLLLDKHVQSQNKVLPNLPPPNAAINTVLRDPPPTAAPLDESVALAFSAPAVPSPIDIPSPMVRPPEPTVVSPLATDHSPALQVSSTALLPPSKSAASSAPMPVFESRQKSQPQGTMTGPPRARAAANELESKLRSNWASPSTVTTDVHAPPLVSRPAMPQRSLSLSHSHFKPRQLPKGLDHKLPPSALGAASALPTLEDIQIEAGVGLPPTSPNAAPLASPPLEAGLTRRFGTMVVRPTQEPVTPSVEVPEGAVSTTGLDPAVATPLTGSIHSEPATSPEEATSKPVFLKGLFSVQTTSRRPRTVIRQDLVRVLNQFDIQHIEIRGGFECVCHGPIHDLEPGSSLHTATNDLTMSTPTSSGVDPASLTPNESQPMVATGVGNVDINTNTPVDALSPSAIPDSPAIGGGSSGVNELPVTTAEGEVQFEVFVVKVPLLLGINGLQFRRVSGNPWQYQTVAKRILNELNL